MLLWIFWEKDSLGMLGTGKKMEASAASEPNYSPVLGCKTGREA